jgi:hypothetical protein
MPPQLGYWYQIVNKSDDVTVRPGNKFAGYQGDDASLRRLPFLVQLLLEKNLVWVKQITWAAEVNERPTGVKAYDLQLGYWVKRHACAWLVSLLRRRGGRVWRPC